MHNFGDSYRLASAVGRRCPPSNMWPQWCVSSEEDEDLSLHMGIHHEAAQQRHRNGEGWYWTKCAARRKLRQQFDKQGWWWLEGFVEHGSEMTQL